MSEVDAKKSPSDPPAPSQRAEGEVVSFADPDAPVAEAEASAAPPAEDPVAVAKAEAARLRDQLLRTAADFDNFRKRARREQDDALRRGKELTLKELLPVFDNLERAMQSAATAPDVKSLADGLRMVGRQFDSTLDKLSVKRVPAVGKPFDPALHEAIQHADSNEHPAGVITAEVQPGYTINEHLMRAALVIVSKGPGPAAEAAPAEAAPAEGTAEGGGGEPAAEAPKAEADSDPAG